MNRFSGSLFAPACLLLPLGCGAKDEPPAVLPGPGVYHLAISGEFEDLLGDELAEPLPDSIELEWPASMTVDLVSYTEDPTRDGDEQGWTLGNAVATVDGAAPYVARVERDGDVANLRLVIFDYPFRPSEPRDCPFTIPYPVEFALRLEGDRAYGSGETRLECIVTQDDAPPLHQYFVALHLELEGARAAE